MNEQTKELIAIGASVAAHCQSCLQFHLIAGKKLGLSEEDVQLAVEIGRMAAKGAISEMLKFSGSLTSPTATSQAQGCSDKPNCCG